MLEKVNINTTDTSNLVKKAEYDTRVVKFKRIADHEHSNKYIITYECSKLTPENYAARLKRANLASKNEIADFVKKTNILIIN